MHLTRSEHLDAFTFNRTVAATAATTQQSRVCVCKVWYGGRQCQRRGCAQLNQSSAQRVGAVRIFDQTQSTKRHLPPTHYIGNIIFLSAHELTRKRNDRVHLHRLHGFAIGRDHGHAVALDRHLCGTYRCECIDQTEPVPTSRRYRKDLQRCVGHEAGVRVTELTAPIDQHRFGILASVDG